MYLSPDVAGVVASLSVRPPKIWHGKISAFLKIVFRFKLNASDSNDQEPLSGILHKALTDYAEITRRVVL